MCLFKTWLIFRIKESKRLANSLCFERYMQLRTGTATTPMQEQQHCQAYATYPSKREIPHVTLAGLSFAFAGRGICKLCIQLSPFCAAVNARYHAANALLITSSGGESLQLTWQ